MCDQGRDLPWHERTLLTTTMMSPRAQARDKVSMGPRGQVQQTLLPVLIHCFGQLCLHLRCDARSDFLGHSTSTESPHPAVEGYPHMRRRGTKGSCPPIAGRHGHPHAYLNFRCYTLQLLFALAPRTPAGHHLPRDPLCIRLSPAAAPSPGHASAAPSTVHQLPTNVVMPSPLQHSALLLLSLDSL